MFEKNRTYILNGKELTNNDLENYLVFDSSLVEDNIKKLLKYDRLEGVPGFDFISFLDNGVILNTNDGYYLYDLNGKRLSQYYVLSFPVKEKISVNNGYDIIKKNNKIGFSKDNKKVISTSYDDGYYYNGVFIMKNGNDIFMFNKDGKNLILDNKIKEVCHNISKYFDIDSKCFDMSLLYKLLSVKIVSIRPYLYDLRTNEVIKADKVITEYRFSTEKKEIIIDSSNKKIKSRKK